MSNRPLVVIADLIVEPLDCERGGLGEFADVKTLDIGSQNELDGQLDEADALMIYHYLPLGRPEIERMKRCRVIARPGVGYDSIDLYAARERGIAVCNVPDYGTEEGADSAMGLALTLTRGTHFLNSRLRAGIDVLECELPPGDSQVLKGWRDPNHPAHHRLNLNPHTAYYCEEGCVEFRMKASREVLRALQGNPLRNRVN